MNSKSQQPEAVKMAINFLEEWTTFHAEGRWEAVLDWHEMILLPTYFDEFRDRNFKDIYNAGGLLVHAIRAKTSEDPRRPKSDSILTLLYPAVHSDARWFFEEFKFGVDEYTSSMTGKYLDPQQNSPLDEWRPGVMTACACRLSRTCMNASKIAS